MRQTHLILLRRIKLNLLTLVLSLGQGRKEIRKGGREKGRREGGRWKEKRKGQRKE